MFAKIDQEIPASCPLTIRPFLIRILERGSVMVVILDGDGRIRWANRCFREALLAGETGSGSGFVDLLQEDSARLLSTLGVVRAGEQGPLDLRHPTHGGHRTVKYQFFPCGDGCIGAIGSDRTEEVELIQQMSALIEDLHREIAQRTELSKELERMATIDFLTGVFNRRQFDKIAQDEWGRMRRYKSHFALMLIDLDRFKEVNDRFGHQAGDEVLRRVAEVLKVELRAEDIVARYGGEEFAVIDLIAGADQALYRGKQSGRNRVETFEPAGAPLTPTPPSAAPAASVDPTAV